MNNFQLSLLPDDILLHEVLPNLPLERLNTLCRTSQKFQNLCNNEELWRIKVLKEYPKYPKPSHLSYSDFYKFLVESKEIPVYVGGNNYGNIRISDKYPEYPLYQASILLPKILKPHVSAFTIVYTDDTFWPIGISNYPSNEIKFPSLLCIDINDIAYSYIIVSPNKIETVNKLDLNKITSVQYRIFLFNEIFHPATDINNIPIYGFIFNDNLYVVNTQLIPFGDINVNLWICDPVNYIYLGKVINFLNIHLNDKIYVPTINIIKNYLITTAKIPPDRLVNIPDNELIIIYKLNKTNMKDVCNSITNKLTELGHFYPTAPLMSTLQ
jgi:hypothetical protein